MKPTVSAILTAAAAVTVVMAIGWGFGYVWGRKSVAPAPSKVITKVEYLPGPTVHDTLRYPVAVRVDVPEVVEVPSKVDTARLYAAWCDYYLKRHYDFDFSRDTLGTFKVGVDVTQNRVVNTISTLAPITRTVTRTETLYKRHKIMYYGAAGTSIDLKSQNISAGVILGERFSLGVTGMRLNNAVGYTVNMGIIFK